MKSKQYFVFVLLVLFVTLTATACREKEAESPTVGMFTSAPSPVTDVLKSEMAKLGYVEGENVIYVVHDAGGDMNAFSQVAQELVDANPDVIALSGVNIAQAILSITEEIPLVVSAGDHVEEGLVDSFRNHGRNLTGVAINQPTALQLEFLLELAPDIERIFVPHNPELTFELYNLGKAKKTAADLGVELVVGEARTDDEAAEMLATNFPADVQAIVIPSNRTTSFPGDDDNFNSFAIEHNLPLAVANDTSVANGALFSYTYSIADALTQVARLTDQILKDVPLSDLPIERPDYYLTINLRTAEAIGLDIPDDILARAQEIIR